MAKDSDRLAGRFELEETGGLSGLLAEEDGFDRRTLWRLGTWAAVSVGAVITAILATQSSIGMRRELTASADLVRQAQQIQTAAKESLNETRRLASAVETLNGDRDRLYSRIAVLEQGLDSVTGTIARQSSAASTPSAAAPAAPAAPNAPSPAATSPATTASSPPAAPATPAAAAEPAPAAPKQAKALVGPAPVVAPVTATAAADEKPPIKSAELGAVQVSPTPVPSPAPTAQTAASLVAPKSMMAPPDPAAAKLMEPASPPKTVVSAPLPDVTASLAKGAEDELEAPSAPELAVRRTEFGVDVGGANSIAGLRALWRGLLKSRANAALTTLRPIIVIRENNNGLGMQLRLVAGPIGDAADAAKICATLTVNDRTCTTAIFEGQRLALSPEDAAKVDAKPTADSVSASVDAKPGPKTYSRKRYRQSQREEPSKPEQPSTLSALFGRR